MRSPCRMLLPFALLSSSPASAQELRTRLQQVANEHVVMLEGNASGCETWAAGVIVGHDPQHVHVVTDIHAVPEDCVSSMRARYQIAGRAGEAAFRVSHRGSSNDDLATLTIARSDMPGVESLNFAILDPRDTYPSGIELHSIGHSLNGSWALGGTETVQRMTDETIQATSGASDGQSGGGLFSDSWDLIGIVQNANNGTLYARSWAAVARQLDAWHVPNLIEPRPDADRARGDDEVARQNAADRLADRAGEALAGQDVLSAMTYLAEARSLIRTSRVHARSLLTPAPILTRQYEISGQDFTAAIVIPGHNRNLLVAGTASGAVEAYRLDTGAQVRRLATVAERVLALSADPTGRWLLVGGTYSSGERVGPDGRVVESHPSREVTVTLVDLDGQSPPRAIPLVRVMGADVSDVGFGPTGRGVALDSNQLYSLDLGAGTETWRQRARIHGATVLDRIDAEHWLAFGNRGAGDRVDLVPDGFMVSSLQLPACEFVPGMSQLVFRGATWLAGNGAGSVARACRRDVIVTAMGTSERHVLTGHTEFVSSLASFASGDRLLSGGWDRVFRVWDPRARTFITRSGLHPGGIMTVDASETGDRIAVVDARILTGPPRGNVSVWSYHPERYLGGIPGIPPPPLPPRATPPTVPAPAQRMFRHGRATCWDAGESTFTHMSVIGAVVTRFGLSTAPPAPPTGNLAVTPSCQWSAAEIGAEVVLFESVTSGRSWARRAAMPIAPASRVEAIVIASDGSRAAWVESDGTPDANGDPSLRVRAMDVSGSVAELVNTRGALFSLAISSRGNRVASYSLEQSSGPIRIWDVPSRRLLSSESHPHGVPAQISFDPASREDALLVSTVGGLLRWRVNGHSVSIPVPSLSEWNSFTTTSDGAIALCVGPRLGDPPFGTALIRALDLRNNQEMFSLELPSPPQALVLSPTNDRLLLQYPTAHEVRGIFDDVARTAVLTGQRYDRRRDAIESLPSNPPPRPRSPSSPSASATTLPPPRDRP